jgi:hypothetical protein
MATSVPNTNTFSLQDVVNVTGGNSLVDAINYSVPEMFDSQFKGVKTGILNDLYSFRNYKPVVFPTVPIYLTNFSDNLYVSNITLNGNQLAIDYPFLSGNVQTEIALTTNELIAQIIVVVLDGMDYQTVTVTDSNGLIQCQDYYGYQTSYLTFENVVFNSSGYVMIDCNSGQCTYAPTEYAPTVSTSTPANIAATIVTSGLVLSSATAGGTVIDSGTYPVTERGICWAKRSAGMSIPYPTINSDHTIIGSGIGGFAGSMTGLTPNSQYYVRAYATNAVGTSYGTNTLFNSFNYSPGASLRGGYLAYIFQPEDLGYVSGEFHGFVCSPEAVFSNSWQGDWNWNGLFIENWRFFNATGVAIGQGGSNTTIVSNWVDAFGVEKIEYAAWQVHNLTTYGYTDWVIPSKTELNEIHYVRGLIPGLISGDYWSSSESSESGAWKMTMWSGDWGPNAIRKDMVFNVLPIRYF